MPGFTTPARRPPRAQKSANPGAAPPSRTARNPPPDKQGPGTAPLPPSPPDTATTHTPATRRRWGKGRRPFVVAALAALHPDGLPPGRGRERGTSCAVAADHGDRVHARHPTVLPGGLPTCVAAFHLTLRQPAARLSQREGRRPSHPPTRTARGPPPGKQGPGTALLTPSLPTTVTTHAPGGRQCCSGGRRPFSLPPSTSHSGGLSPGRGRREGYLLGRRGGAGRASRPHPRLTGSVHPGHGHAGRWAAGQGTAPTPDRERPATRQAGPGKRPTLAVAAINGGHAHTRGSTALR